jgi:hypothetical protein
MSLAPERLSIGLRRLYTSPGVDPYDEVEWEHRDARITNWKDGSIAFEQTRCRVPEELVGQRHQHRGPEVLPREPRQPRAGVVAAPGDRPGRRDDHPLGRRGRLLRRRRRGRHVPRRAEVHPRHPAGRVQQPGLVQHRRQGRPPAGLGVPAVRRTGEHAGGSRPDRTARGGRCGGNEGLRRQRRHTGRRHREQRHQDGAAPPHQGWVHPRRHTRPRGVEGDRPRHRSLDRGWRDPAR